MNLIIVGLGGIGSHLLLPIYQYLQYEKNIFEEIILVDGDKYEEKNKSRQVVIDYDNKAIVTADYYRKQFDKVITTFFDQYITSDNISKIITNNDIVLLCVDNHKTRKVFENYCKELDNITIISGGNELYDGNIMIFNRINKENITPLFTELHPEIIDSKDKSPEEMSCEELLESSPQIGIVNATISDIMRRNLFAILHKGIRHYEIFVNCLTATERRIKFNDINKIIKLGDKHE